MADITNISIPKSLGDWIPISEISDESLCGNYWIFAIRVTVERGLNRSSLWEFIVANANDEDGTLEDENGDDVGWNVRDMDFAQLLYPDERSINA
jgi:hypothetical protein